MHVQQLINYYFRSYLASNSRTTNCYNLGSISISKSCKTM